MVNITKFIKDHIPLCVFTMGLAVLGYLGYHVIRLIIIKCQRTEKIDQLVQKIIKGYSHSSRISGKPSAQSSKSLGNRVSHLEKSQDKVTVGQGEYLVFHRLATGEKQPLSQETFKIVYQVLIQHSPELLANSGSENAIEDCANRYELIKARLKEIDPTLEAVFVPRTLYELVFIKKCIKEDLRNKDICSYLDPGQHKFTLEKCKGNREMYEAILEEDRKAKLERKCWHLCYFKDPGDNEHEGVKEVAFRLNNAMFKAFNPDPEGFTLQEFSVFVENKITSLKNYHNKCSELTERLNKGEEVEIIRDSGRPGPTTNFGFEDARKPMGIRNEADAQIIRDAVALECSKIAKHSLFLYRGSDFQKDSTNMTDQDAPYSLSFGRSLFAGCLFDAGATAFHYMRNEKNAYAVSVAFNQADDSPFFAPATHTVAQLFGDGEIFHARTKAWKDFDLDKIGGIQGGANGHLRDHLSSKLSKEELNSQFQEYKDKAFHLK